MSFSPTQVSPASSRHDSPRQVIDQYGRQLRYLRVSVTDVCNLSCQYCNPVKGCGSLHPHKLSWDDLFFMADVGVRDLGVEAIRITGGEPTVRPGLLEWIERLAKLPGLSDIAMTTNGIRLGQLAEPLAKAGLRRVNISLDSFDADKFHTLTRGGSLQRCMEGIQAANEHFQRVKLNTVLLRGLNAPDGLEEFVRFSDEHGIECRFIELMPLFDQKDYFHRHFISVEETMDKFRELGYQLDPEGDGAAVGNRSGYGPATTYRVRGTRARLGFISQMSDTKCLHCNKLRLTSDGALKACLLSPEEQDLVPIVRERDREQLGFIMSRQFLVRAERYDYQEALNDPFHRGMQSTGG